MPKKSRKEKIRAELRRKAYTAQVQTVEHAPLVKEEPSSVFRFQMKQELPKKQPALTDITELTAIKQDLYKKFVLATIAIAAEIVIYLVRH